ncbi:MULTISPECIES: NADP-dependent oxidoreductase [unclassified Yimella]|uniref:NADP-dependent oxidoreductase n=1 Tax=unclassified Yimella TaxID=2649892 RepID=UPI00101D86C6|nr:MULTISPECIES: NADP-dependent oxidoreductase [unclassified Yimella]MCG8656848.1 NADP-dependent oxidoreductase [Yimella sp. NH-Cas1]RYG76372.1 NADP-dependent oxidoreductase [Yimella sp. RIT 621]
MSLPTRTREIQLASRPSGAPTPDNFRLMEVDLPELKDGEILVRNTVMSVDPYMRGRMNDVKSYVPPFQIDQPLDGGAVGTVIASRSDEFAEGQSVLHGLGWREHAILPAGRATAVDTSDLRDSSYLGVLGMPGLTAYAGLMAAAEFQPGDAVFVSGAAGAVGSLVGQIARLSGASRVVGSAGSAAKVERLIDLGFDAAFDYHDGSVRDSLKKAAPDGIDVYFDNVGGDHLEAAISALNVDGRVAMCGAISQYNATEPACAPRNLALAIGKRLTLRGFIVGKYSDMRDEFLSVVGPWLADGSIQWDETVREGLENAPQAFIDLLAGANTGKMIVRL